MQSRRYESVRDPIASKVPAVAPAPGSPLRRSVPRPASCLPAAVTTASRWRVALHVQTRQATTRAANGSSTDWRAPTLYSPARSSPE